MEWHRLHPYTGVLGWFPSCQMERRKWSYFKKWGIGQDRSTSSHSFRSWTRTSKWNWWITMVSTSTSAMSRWLPLHFRSMGSAFWIEFWIENQPNTPTSTLAACWHLRQLGMHLGTMQRTGYHCNAAWHMSVWKLGWPCRRSLPMLQKWPGSAIATVAPSAS